MPKTVKKSKDRPYHIAYYVENNIPSMRKFGSLKDMRAFFKEFKKYYPKGSESGDSFVHFYITNISGEVKFP